MQGVDLEVNQGEVFWFIWPNGSWKTTTLKCVLWFLKPTWGEISLFGKSLSEDQWLLKKIWYAPESAYYYDHLNGIEFLVFMGKMAGLTKQEAELNWLDLLEKLWLSFAKNHYVKSYSKWMKQRLWLASSLIHNPEFVVWDEPMSWLDPLWRKLVKDLIKELHQKWKTVFFNTHILSDVEEIADKFSIIHQWKIISSGDPKQLEVSLEDHFTQLIQQEGKEVRVI